MAGPFRRERAAAVLDEPEPEAERRRMLTGENWLPTRPSHRTTVIRSPREEPSRALIASAMSTLTAASENLRQMMDRRKNRLQRSQHGETAPDRARQVLAWQMYDEVGELREAAHLIVDTVASADLYVGRVVPGKQAPERLPEPEEQGDSDDYTRSDLPEAVEAIEELLLGMVESGAMVRMATQLFVGAETFLLGVPRDPEDAAPRSSSPTSSLTPVPSSNTPVLDENLVWHALSFDELRHDAEQRLPGHGEDTIEALIDGEWYLLDVSKVIGISIWQAHPRQSNRLDSGVLSALPILLQLVAIGQYAGAAIDSRLAGAGVFVIPLSALNLPEGTNPDDPAAVKEALGNFMSDFTEAMVTPIEDRSSPSAVVPITIAVEDEATGKFQHLTFEVPLGGDVDAREEHLIKRLARSLDLPPDQLLGVGDMNHWSAWQVDEATVKAHVEPMLRAIVVELTVAILWPTLIDGGMTAKEARRWAIGFDTSRLVLRPNRATEAQALFDRDVISDRTLRRVAGYDESDAPETGDEWNRAVNTALELVARAPTLGANPGVRALTDAIYSLYTAEPGDTAAGDDVLDTLPTMPGADQEVNDPAEEPEEGDDSPLPDTQDDDREAIPA
jgi:hypothetical protein